MTVVVVLDSGQEAPGHHPQSQLVIEDAVTACGTIPTTLTRPSVPAAAIPQTQRRSLRARKPTERTRNVDEGSDNDTGADGESTEPGRKTQGRRGRPPKAQKAQPRAEDIAPALTQLLPGV